MMGTPKKSLSEHALSGNPSGRALTPVPPVPAESERLTAEPPKGLGRVGKLAWAVIRNTGWWLRDVHAHQVLDACEHFEYLNNLRAVMRSRHKRTKAADGGGVEYRTDSGQIKEYPAHAAYVAARKEWRAILAELGMTVQSQVDMNLAEKVGAGDPKDEQGDYF